MSRGFRTLASLLHRPNDGAPHVHFHRGPQGHPAPCFDTGCRVPRLSDPS
jgi:hypothetical protein